MEVKEQEAFGPVVLKSALLAWEPKLLWNQ